MERGLYDGSIRLGTWAHCGLVLLVRARAMCGPAADVQGDVHGSPARAAAALGAADGPSGGPAASAATGRTLPPPERGPTPTEIEAENLARTWPC